MQIETDIDKRWEQGLPHHQKSIEIYNSIEKIDFEYGNDYFLF